MFDCKKLNYIANKFVLLNINCYNLPIECYTTHHI